VRVFDPDATPFSELRDADLVLDTARGDLARKRELFARLDAAAHPRALLAASTPELDLDSIAASTRRPEAVVGIRFVSPARGRILEVARGRNTSPETCAAALQLGKAFGKVGVLVSASPGGVGERLFERWAREASRLVAEGAHPEQVERVLFDFGFAGAELARARLSTDPLRATNGAASRISDREILERCVFGLVNESARLLDEQVAARPVEIDVICVLGFGFPAHRGGPLFYADEVGSALVFEFVKQYRAKVGGDAWTPAATLEQMAASRGRFYAAP